MTDVHVGYVLKVYPRHSETFIVNEILQLEQRGARVTVYSLNPPREGRFHEKLARVQAEVTYLPNLTTHELLELLAANPAALREIRGRLAEAVWQVIERGDVERMKLVAKAVALHLALRRTDVAHLHAHFATSATDVASLAAGFSDLPFSFTAHAKDIYLSANDVSSLGEHMRAARFVVTVCDANRRHLEAIGPDEARVHRIYNGLDLEEFLPGPRLANAVPEILAVGRLVPKKGFDTLLRSCAVLAGRGIPFRCRIVGAGPERDALEALSEDLRLGGRVDFTGPLSNERVRQLMASSDVVALPARIADDGNRDALPTVLLEALALGTPVVSTPVTGIPEIVGDGVAGELVPPDSPDRLADALHRLLRDPAACRARGTAGRERAERLFDGRANVGLLLDLFRESAALRGDAGRELVGAVHHAPRLS
ncbi:MAG: glycosyltransferase [Candidatus Eiseniibacteriota bacterium]